MANEDDITFVDPEFQTTTGNERIDFKQILFQQINYIRWLRTQNMGEFEIFNLDYLPDDRTMNRWFNNISMFQNAVKAYQRLLTTYQDKEYKEEIRKLEKNYNKKLNQALEEIRKNTKLQNKIDKVRNVKRNFAICNMPRLYDSIFSETLKLTKKAKYIGGDDFIEETV